MKYNSFCQATTPKFYKVDHKKSRPQLIFVCLCQVRQVTQCSPHDQGTTYTGNSGLRHPERIRQKEKITSPIISIKGMLSCIILTFRVAADSRILGGRLYLALNVTEFPEIPFKETFIFIRKNIFLCNILVRYLIFDEQTYFSLL